MTSTVSPTARPKAGSVTRVEVSEHGALGAEVAQLVPLGAIHAQGREASGLACRRSVVVALRLGLRAFSLCLRRRGKVDAQHHFDIIGLGPHHEPDINAENSAKGVGREVRSCVWCRGRRVCAGAPRARIENRACSTRVIGVTRLSNALRQVWNRIAPRHPNGYRVERTAMADGANTLETQ